MARRRRAAAAREVGDSITARDRARRQSSGQTRARHARSTYIRTHARTYYTYAIAIYIYYDATSILRPCKRSTIGARRSCAMARFLRAAAARCSLLSVLAARTPPAQQLPCLSESLSGVRRALPTVFCAQGRGFASGPGGEPGGRRRRPELPADEAAPASGSEPAAAAGQPAAEEREAEAAGDSGAADAWPLVAAEGEDDDPFACAPPVAARRRAHRPDTHRTPVPAEQQSR